MSGTERALYVKGLVPETKTSDLWEQFEKYGKLKDVYIPKDHFSGVARDFALVKFDRVEDAETAMDKIGEMVICGKPVSIEWAKGRRKDAGEMTRQSGRGRSRSRSPRRNRDDSRDRYRDRYRDDRRSRSRDRRQRSPARRSPARRSPARREYSRERVRDDSRDRGRDSGRRREYSRDRD